MVEHYNIMGPVKAALENMTRYFQAIAQSMRDSAQYFQTMEDLLSQHLEDIPRRHAEELTNSFAEFQTIVNTSVGNASQAFRATSEYLLASQRWVLFVDALRQRGNTYLTHEAAGSPPVLAYDFAPASQTRRGRGSSLSNP